jgi:hypothetical protein
LIAACPALFDPANRKARSLHALDSSAGVYALYLNYASILPEIACPHDMPLYIGKADGAGGLKRRCHFYGGTRNHSPRKSLACLLEDELALRAVPIKNRDGSYKTWGLDSDSERCMDGWMHANLSLAIFATPHAARIEKKLLLEWAAPLNLKGCAQSSAHLEIGAMRAAIGARMKSIVAQGS